MTRTEYTRCDRAGCRNKTEDEYAKDWRKVTIVYPRQHGERSWDVCSVACLRKLLRAMADDMETS